MAKNARKNLQQAQEKSAAGTRKICSRHKKNLQQA